MKIRRKMHNKCVAVVRVLRTIRRYWIANINIRTAEVSIISLQQSARSFFSSLSLLFLGSCRCCFFACLLLYFFIPKSAKWFDGSYAELNCVVLNVDTNKSNVQFNVNRIRFLTLSSLFFLIRFDSSAPVVTVPPNEAIELRFVGTMKLLWQMYVTKPIKYCKYWTSGVPFRANITKGDALIWLYSLHHICRITAPSEPANGLLIQMNFDESQGEQLTER